MRRHSIFWSVAVLALGVAGFFWHGGSLAPQPEHDSSPLNPGSDDFARGEWPGASATAAPAATAGLELDAGEEAPRQDPDRIARQQLADSIHHTMAGRLDTCRSVQNDLLRLLIITPESDRLWSWAMDRAQRCLAAPRRHRPDSRFLEELARSKPDHPRVRQQLGLSAYEQGDLREAVFQLKPVAETLDDFLTWQTLADAQLSLAREMTVTRELTQAQEQQQMALQSAQRALALASPAQLPFALHAVARAELDLGRLDVALQHADQVLAAMSGVPSGSQQAALIQELQIFVGQIYFRAGQTQAGIAYMNQGIAMAQSSRQRAGLIGLRDQFLKGRS